MSDTPTPGAEIDEAPAQAGPTRRSVVGYLLAAPTLAVGIRLGADFLEPAAAAVISPPGPADLYDLNTMLTNATMPTANLITLVVNTDGTVDFALPRSENGQGITTSTAMLIADEMDTPVSTVNVTLADARPELLFNQLTGGSNTTISTYTPIRSAAAAARQALINAAARQWGVPASSCTTSNGYVNGPNGLRASYGSLAASAAVPKITPIGIALKPSSQFKVVGKPHGRVDARAIVTGKKIFAMDLKVPGALPTMVCRPPTINGTVVSVNNKSAVLAMPGVTHVATIPTGVAVRAKTFGQCIDAVRALNVTWGPGPDDGETDASILAKLKAAEIPLAVPAIPLLATTVDTAFTFWFASNSPLETNAAVADVRPGSATVWGALKSPITAQERIAQELGMPVSAVTVHVTEGGGSFGRKLFFDAALEAAQASRAMGVPVRLMWHRTDDFRQGRTHPMSTNRVRATYLAGNVLTWEQRHTSIATDFTHGLGEIITAEAASLPVGNIGFSQTVYELTQAEHYNVGVTTNLLNEVDTGFNTGSMRNIYSPNVAVARELTIDKLAAVANMDPYQFRRQFANNPRSVAVLDAVAKAGNWGRTMPTGTAQGIAIHNEYHGFAACLIEIDCTPATVNRVVRDAVTGPRVTKAVFAVDVGLPLNPLGLQAQMMGGIMDGIALALTSSLHLTGGYFAEGSWDNYAYTREWNVPFDVEVIVMPPTTDSPGGAGEFGVAAAFAATAAAYARATKTMPTSFPINHQAPLYFPPLPTTPSIPQSPTNGLTNY